jgi:[acyl-carrier-protein] S-malonyltransferase
VLRERGIEPSLVAGHSVGEFTALVAAGALTFEDALLAVRERGRLMARVPLSGRMVGIVGLVPARVAEICSTISPAAPLAIGLVNGPTFVVVSGADEAVTECARLATEAGALRTFPLAVDHAFHSPLMGPARGGWIAVVERLPLREPAIPVALNVTGTLAAGVPAIRTGIIDQLTSTVRWSECVAALVDAGATTFIEVGDSKSLTTLGRSMIGNRPSYTTLDPKSLDRLTRSRGSDQAEKSLGTVR